MAKSLVLGSLLLIAAAVVISEACGPHQVYDSCGSACPDYCNKDQSEVCTMQCVPGCYCDDGDNYTKRAIDADNADCVKRTECPTCGANQIYKMCGTACQDYCGKPSGTSCIEICVEGCFCKDGYVRSVDNNTAPCIEVDLC